MERVLNIPLEALKGISNFSRFLNLHLEISLRNFSKLAQDKFSHWLVGIGFWILHGILHRSLRFIWKKIYKNLPFLRITIWFMFPNVTQSYFCKMVNFVAILSKKKVLFKASELSQIKAFPKNSNFYFYHDRLIRLMCKGVLWSSIFLSLFCIHFP